MHSHPVTARRAVVVAVLGLNAGAGGAAAQDSRASAQALSTDNCLTSGCHAELMAPAFVHAPVSSHRCDACHRVSDPDEHTFELNTQEPAMCYECHDKDGLNEVEDDGTGRASRHAPFVMGQCLTCHDPHGGPQQAMLRPGGQFAKCVDCHDELIDPAAVVHSPIQTPTGCLACHRGHHSPHFSLMTEAFNNACTVCHTEFVKQMETMTHVHAPVGSRECVSCHDPHASIEPKLLSGAFSADLYVPVEARERYDLCFQCHDAELLDERETDATGFRNGELNLHHLHSHRATKGRSCRACHEAHGGTQPRLIRESVEMGRWRMTIRYRSTETGGACGPACHATKSYDREQPVDWTTPPLMGGIDKTEPSDGDSP